MRDWNLRVMLHRIWAEQSRSYKSWAIQLDPNPIDEEFWHRRGSTSSTPPWRSTSMG